MTTSIFTEAIDLTEAIIDTDNRVLKDVVLIRAGESANRRDYPPDVLAASVPVFENVKAYADHPSRTEIKERAERSIRGITGWYANVRFDGTRLLADRHFVPTQAGNDAWAIAEMVATGKAPKSLAGLSINAVGKARKRDDGGMVVEAITAAESVDDVTTPAAGGSYIESAGQYDLLTAALQELSFDEWYQSRPEFIERVRNEMKTVRQEKALTDAQALAERLQADHDTLQAELSQLKTERDAALAESTRKDRQMMVAKLLTKANLPANWKESIEATLMKAEPETWPGLIQDEISKAKSAGHKPLVTVNVPGPQEATPPKVTVRESLAPYDDEDPIQYQQRLQRIRQGK